MHIWTIFEQVHVLTKFETVHKTQINPILSNTILCILSHTIQYISGSISVSRCTHTRNATTNNIMICNCGISTGIAYVRSIQLTILYFYFKHNHLYHLLLLVTCYRTVGTVYSWGSMQHRIKSHPFRKKFKNTFINNLCRSQIDGWCIQIKLHCIMIDVWSI